MSENQHHGWLFKRCRSVTTQVKNILLGRRLWKRRWFVLRSSTLEWHFAGDDSAINGTLSLDGYEITTCETNKESMALYGRQNVTILSHKSRRSLILAANSKVEMDEWILKLRIAIKKSIERRNNPFEDVASLARFTRHCFEEKSKNHHPTATTTPSTSSMKENMSPCYHHHCHPQTPIRKATTLSPKLSFFTATLSNEVLKLHIQLAYFDPKESLELDSLRGQLLITNYMICFVPDHKARVNLNLPSSYFEIPLGTIERLEKIELEKGEGAFLIRLVTRDARPDLRFSFKNAQTSLRVMNCIREEIKIPFSLSLPSSSSSSSSHKHVYDPIPDFTRMKILEMEKYRLFENKYELCETYPYVVCIPAEITDEHLKQSCKFRSKSRFPALVFQSLLSGATLWRSSQPRTGMINRCEHDEHILRVLAKHSNDSKLTVVDCRPRLNAMANRIKGGGTESEYYENIELIYLNIENIHAVRKSLQGIFSLVKDKPPCEKWNAAVEDTLWLTHIRQILLGARVVACELRRGRNVLVHCSDGWDRTPQICALSELMSDSYYRTIDGFLSLVRKEWYVLLLLFLFFFFFFYLSIPISPLPLLLYNQPHKHVTYITGSRLDIALDNVLVFVMRIIVIHKDLQSFCCSWIVFINS